MMKSSIANASLLLLALTMCGTPVHGVGMMGHIDRSFGPFSQFGSLMSLMDFPFENHFGSQWHRDVAEHFGRQFQCAQLCADRNQEIRSSSISNARPLMRTDTNENEDAKVSSHFIEVALPGVDASDIKVTALGDTLRIEASRKWTEELIPTFSDEFKACNCKNVGAELVGKDDRFSTQIRLGQNVAKDQISVDFQKADDGQHKLVVSVPEKEPKSFEIRVREIEVDVEAPKDEQS